MHSNPVGVLQGSPLDGTQSGCVRWPDHRQPVRTVKKAAARGETPVCALPEQEASGLVHVVGHPLRGTNRAGTQDRDALGKACSTKVGDFDLEGARPAVKVHRFAGTRTRTVVTATKTGGAGTMKIGPRTVEVLRAHRARQCVERIAASPWEDTDCVFPNRQGPSAGLNDALATLHPRRHV
jgi:hypothetical protein